ncbi:hypothetical protein N7447_008189 [Penicillium robsamsonii]|uniref:uncharacterized protein n=1 Tax=Penicillium robsamsonii TaxID=1792511 RepID=UPI0025480B6F|nr:uncharacterized protein N7447_008189 [Penicillium robsamsonii]KAJ5815956.1 hypothetical protein N7447_008189 [Penicillium robsamsonii]
MASKIVSVNDDIVAKYGDCALVYLEQHVPEGPVPRLYAMNYGFKQLFLVMQRVPGVPLNSIWPFLANTEKDDIIGNPQVM